MANDSEVICFFCGLFFGNDNDLQTHATRIHSRDYFLHPLALLAGSSSNNEKPVAAATISPEIVEMPVVSQDGWMEERRIDVKINEHFDPNALSTREIFYQQEQQQEQQLLPLNVSATNSSLQNQQLDDKMFIGDSGHPTVRSIGTELHGQMDSCGPVSLVVRDHNNNSASSSSSSSSSSVGSKCKMTKKRLGKISLPLPTINNNPSISAFLTPASSSSSSLSSRPSSSSPSSHRQGVKCFVCSSYYVNKKCMKQHMKKKHAPFVEPITNNTSRNNPNHSQQPQQQQPQQQQQLSFFCKACAKSFSTQMALITHSCIIAGNRTFACPLCPATFRQINYRNLHVTSHHGTYPGYCCDICNRVFTRRNNLMLHQRLHAELFPYRCNFCDKIFRHTNELRVHSVEHCDLMSTLNTNNSNQTQLPCQSQ